MHVSQHTKRKREKKKKACPPNTQHEIEPKCEQGSLERPYWVLPSTLASSTRMISLRRMAGEVCRTLYTVLSRVLQASLWNTIITLVVGKGGHLLKVCSIHLQRQEGEGEESTKIWLCFTVPERCCGLVITCAGPPLWGVHFICDSACVAAPLKYPPYQSGELTCSSPHCGSKSTLGFHVCVTFLEVH